MSTETQLAPSEHHPLGPSTWPARMECIAFDPMPDVDLEDVDGSEEDAPIEVEDRSARGRGVAMHKACAMLLVGDLEMRQKALEGLSEREVGQVQWAVAKAIEIVESHGYAQSDIRVEQRVTLYNADSFEPLYFGTCDVECGPLDFDFKFAEPRNYFAQLVGYALPKMEDRGENRRYGHILNGRYRRVEKYVLDRQTVQSIGYGFLARVTAKERKPTACSYCGFCRHKLTCSAIAPVAVSLVERREDWRLKLPTPHVSQMHDPAWLGAARFVWLNFLKKWGSAVEFASSSLPAGVAPAGYRLRPEKGRQSIANVQKAVAVLEPIVGAEAIWDSMDLPIGTLAKAYAGSAGISEEKAKTAIVSALADARLLAVGLPSTKLIAEKNAEELIRAALDLRRDEERPIPVEASEKSEAGA